MLKMSSMPEQAASNERNFFMIRIIRTMDLCEHHEEAIGNRQ